VDQPKRGPVTLKGVRVLRVSQSGKGLRVRLPDGRTDWLPRSQIVGGEAIDRGYLGDVTIPAWLAEEVFEVRGDE